MDNVFSSCVQIILTVQGLDDRAQRLHKRTEHYTWAEQRKIEGTFERDVLLGMVEGGMAKQCFAGSCNGHWRPTSKKEQ